MPMNYSIRNAQRARKGIEDYLCKKDINEILDEKVLNNINPEIRGEILWDMMRKYTRETVKGGLYSIATISALALMQRSGISFDGLEIFLCIPSIFYIFNNSLKGEKIGYLSSLYDTLEQNNKNKEEKEK